MSMSSVIQDLKVQIKKVEDELHSTTDIRKQRELINIKLGLEFTLKSRMKQLKHYWKTR